MFSKKLIIISMMAFCVFFAASMSALAAEADDLSGNWTVNVKWVNPEIIGDYPMTIVMNNPFFGTVDSEGLPGTIVNIIILVIWKFEHEVDPTYKGLAFGSIMFGKMENNQGNYGTWWATKGGVGAAGGLDVIAGAQ